MADILRKIVVPNELLPPVGTGNKHFFRYRIVSEDGNRTSHWSPIQSTSGITYTTTSASGAVSQMGNIIMTTWQIGSDIPSFDIFVKFNTDDYFYSGTTNVRNYSLVKSFPYASESSPTSISVIVQVASQEKQINEDLVIWESDTYPLV